MPIFERSQDVGIHGGTFNDVARDQTNYTNHDNRQGGHNFDGPTAYRQQSDTYGGNFNGGNFGGNGKGGNGYKGITESKSKNTRQVQNDEDDSGDDSGEEARLIEEIKKAKANLKAKEKQERKEKLKAELAALNGK